MQYWPNPEPSNLDEVHPALADSCRDAAAVVALARQRYRREQLAEELRLGADGTATMRIDQLVEDAIVAVAERHHVNVLSEECGFLDHGSAGTLVVDPLDGSANAAAGVPLSCFSGVLLDDGEPVQALTCWLETGRTMIATAGKPVEFRTSGRHQLAGSALSLLRPKTGPRGDNSTVWMELAHLAGRVRILSTSCLEAMLVADGATDAFADAGSDTHRIVDLAAAMVFVPAAGGFVGDAFDRPLEFSTDLTLRYSGVVAASRQLADEIRMIVVGAQVPESGPGHPPDARDQLRDSR